MSIVGISINMISMIALLMNEYRLWTFPVVVGNGRRLFSDSPIPAKHKLIKFEACPSGAFMHFYQPVEAVYL